jgi:hypothetical protein
MTRNAPNKPGIARPLVWEEMSPSLREFYDPRRQQGSQVPECDFQYHPYEMFDTEMPSCHRSKK